MVFIGLLIVVGIIGPIIVIDSIGIITIFDLMIFVMGISIGVLCSSIVIIGTSVAIVVSKEGLDTSVRTKENQLVQFECHHGIGFKKPYTTL